MHRLSSLLVVSCVMLSTFALPSICSPSSTSFVVAASSNALFRDSARLAERLNRIVSEIRSALDSEDQNEDDEEQEELADEQEIQQSASEDLLEDLAEGDQIIGTINEAEALWGKKKSAEEVAEAKARAKARKEKSAQEYEQSKKAVNGGLLKVSSAIGSGMRYPLVKGHQYGGRFSRSVRGHASSLKYYLSKEGRTARALARAKKQLGSHESSSNKLKARIEQLSPSNSRRIQPNEDEVESEPPNHTVIFPQPEPRA